MGPSSLELVWKSFVGQAEPKQLREVRGRYTKTDKAVRTEGEAGSPREQSQASKCTQASGPLPCGTSAL